MQIKINNWVGVVEKMFRWGNVYKETHRFGYVVLFVWGANLYGENW